MKILVTGGAGYIGSHTVLSLLKKGKEVIVIDSLINSCYESLRRVELLANKKIVFIKGDICDKPFLEKVFDTNNIDCVIHFAAFKSVSESIKKPVEYYNNNISGTLNLIDVMSRKGCRKLIFSSSATVYGTAGNNPSLESHKIGGTTNPYGTSKLICELMLKDVASAKSMNIISLRYFNPVGAHPSGEIGECPNGIPNNLVPYISQVAVGKLAKVYVFGNDYDTKDGTGIRDYIHVMDLAEGHVKSLDYIFHTASSYQVFNLGTGRGYSVLDVLKTFEKVSGVKINYEFHPRRAGDAAASWADINLAKSVIGWTAEHDLEQMLRDTWNWQNKYPNGY
jgi:UDP-glucose 4-epimerase